MPHTPSARLILFTRFPEPGETKTRLIPALGPAGAAALSGRLAEAACRTARRAAAALEAELEIRLAAADPNQGRVWLGGDLSVRPQGWGGLGRRMQRAFAEAWREGMHRVVLFGSDCPGLAPRHLLAACQALISRDVVLGP
ncbi:MAG: DUF2064 domain-containing protein, partial [Candidatus Latescibacterota bacterium]